MVREGLDDLDRHIIYELQVDARHTSSNDIAEQMDVSSSTVRNRIARLEDQGILRGYHADVDYERTTFQFHTQIVCTAPIPGREEMARAALDVPGVVGVQEVMTGEENVLVKVIGEDSDDLSRISQNLAELGLQVADEDIVRNEYVRPHHGFDRSPGTDKQSDPERGDGKAE